MSLNIIENKIIPFDDSYSFSFLEDFFIKFFHPVSNYYLKLNDLSINLLISLKWVKWGYFFLSSISNELKNIDNDYQLNVFIDKSLQSINKMNLIKEPHLLLIDDKVIVDSNDFNDLLENFYSKDIFDSNTKIHLKLKLNIDEYLIISNILFPTLIKFK